eukprot:CAMPEP_0119131244 /NCGR_PEP_ID=MMETSP1310-20130426/9833_1 /TAXON_ID=464262 /ORGANISM="Genus nov. species nov., Strain RCC2339" /LENGTH=121 /DNA_ID=CAMNT_0007121801 /DNA_START=183 /DNA_END=548 /DNA_ORIENTATION=+
MEVLGDKWPENYYLCQNMYEDIHEKCVCCPDTANKLPYPCLCFESFCFTGGAVSGSRYYLSKEYGLEDTMLEKVFGICLAISVFCGLVGSFYAVLFTACLGNQQTYELKDRGGSSKQPLQP